MALSKDEQDASAIVGSRHVRDAPMGRPARRKLALPSTPVWPIFNAPDDSTSATETLTLSSDSSPSSVLQGFTQLEVDTLLGLSALAEVASGIEDLVHSDPGEINDLSTSGVESSSVFEEIPLPALSTSLTSRISSAPPASPTAQPALACACLASCYLTMDHLSKNEKLTFPSGLRPLRKAIATASEMAHCQVCPGNSLFAMQNVQLLVTLVMSIVKQYDVILQSIDEEGDSLDQQAHTKHLHFKIAEDEITNSSTTDISLDYPIEVSPTQWTTLAKKVVKNEVYGKGGSQDSLWALLIFLEQRQFKWHDVLPKRDCRHNHQPDDEPFCIKIIWKSKELLAALKFQDADEGAQDEQ
ncbi:hypothetical protein HG530_013744 [Fusarium avenaceum]|nr:hypothetical protein HG530_013744 [Fusarium avenaceum]